MFKLLMVLFSVTFFAFLSENTAKKKTELQLTAVNSKLASAAKMDFWAFTAAMIMAFLSGLRTSYNDTFVYISNFRNADTIAEYIDSDKFKFTGNPLFYLFNSFVHEKTDNYHIFFVIIGVFCFLCYVRFFKKHAPYFTLSMYLFISMGTCVFMIAAMKQSIAVAILTFAIDKLVQKKYVGFCLFVLLATGFHFYAIIFAVLPFFMTKPWNAKTYVLLVCVLVVMLTFESTLTAFIEASDDMGKNISEEEVFDGYSMNFLRVVVYSVVPIISLVFRKKIFEDSTPSENLFVNMSIICFFINCMGTISAANLFSRLATYFEFGTIVSLPIVVRKAFQKETADSVITGAVVCYFGYFLYEFIISKDFGGTYSSIGFLNFLKGVLE